MSYDNTAYTVQVDELCLITLLYHELFMCACLRQKTFVVVYCASFTHLAEMYL